MEPYEGASRVHALLRAMRAPHEGASLQACSFWSDYTMTPYTCGFLALQYCGFQPQQAHSCHMGRRAKEKLHRAARLPTALKGRGQTWLKRRASLRQDREGDRTFVHARLERTWQPSPQAVQHDARLQRKIDVCMACRTM
eukprot:547265-Pelagomonas_calceolata.AAC.2